MNFVHIESLMLAIEMIISNKIQEGEYCIKNKKFTNIKKIIDSLNNKLKKKIKVKYLSSEKFSNNVKKFKNLPYWSDKKNMENFLLHKLQKQSNEKSYYVLPITPSKSLK